MIWEHVEKKVKQKREKHITRPNGGQRTESKKQLSKHVVNRVVKDESIKVGTWNVRGTYVPGKLKQIVNELKKYEYDLVALQETKQLGNEIRQIDDYIYFNSGGNNRMLGTGFLVRGGYKTAIVEFKPITERMCYLRLRGKYQKMVFMNIHAPTEEAGMEQKEAFYNKLDTEYEKLPRYDLKVILGDANAKIGREEQFRPTIGKFSKHEKTNENGQLLIDFAREKGMIVKSTYFEKKDIHKATWRSPDGTYMNQIDHVLIEKDIEKSIRDIRSCRGLDADSDHFLVSIKMKQEIPCERNRQRNKRVENETIELTDEKDRMEYREKLREQLNSMQGGKEIDQLWEDIKMRMEAAASNYKRREYSKRKRWFDEECQAELDKRKQMRMSWLRDNSEQIRRQYLEQRNKCKKMMREKKRKYNEGLVEVMEEDYRRNMVRNLYRGLRRERQGITTKPIFYEDEEGQLVGGEDEILELWKNYFNELLNEQVNEEETESYMEEVEQREQETDEPPSTKEIEEIVANMKPNKCPGNDKLTAELFKYGGESLTKWMHILMGEIWKQEKFPKDWNEAILLPIYKKGKKTKCSNYRGIALLNVAYKILTTHLKNKMTAIVENEIGEYQCGFRKGRSVIDQLYTLREIQSESYAYGKETYVLFVDFRQAYDRVKRAELYQALTELGITGKLLRLIRLTLKETNNRVKVGRKTSGTFTVKEGLRQGDPLSSLLFSCALEIVIRRANLYRSGLLYHKRHQCLAFADDLAILTRNKKELQECIIRLEEAAQKMGLQINEDKTKMMTWSDRDFNKSRSLKITTRKGKVYNFEEVEHYTYLGTEFYRGPNITEEIQARLMKGNRCIQGLRRMLHSKTISRSLKLKIYKTIIRPIVVYGSEVWTLGIKEQTMLGVWERKILRKIYGGKRSAGGWERRTNKEIQELYREPDVVAVVKGQRLRWMGHIMRMSNDRIPKKLLQSNIGGRRRRGRPRTRWREEVVRDLEECRISSWREKTQDRQIWKRTVEQAMGLLGLKS